MTKKTFILCIMALVLAGCGQRHKAKTLVGGFISENTTLADMSHDYGRLDSTHRITPEAIATMRQQAAQMPQLKKGISYAEPTPGEALMYTRVTLRDANDTLTLTFYMDKALEKIIACKEN